jgi:hypothetical protein
MHGGSVSVTVVHSLHRAFRRSTNREQNNPRKLHHYAGHREHRSGEVARIL